MFSKNVMSSVRQWPSASNTLSLSSSSSYPMQAIPLPVGQLYGLWESHALPMRLLQFLSSGHRWAWSTLVHCYYQRRNKSVAVCHPQLIRKAIVLYLAYTICHLFILTSAPGASFNIVKNIEAWGNQTKFSTTVCECYYLLIISGQSSLP